MLSFLISFQLVLLTVNGRVYSLGHYILNLGKEKGFITVLMGTSTCRLHYPFSSRGY